MVISSDYARWDIDSYNQVLRRGDEIEPQELSVLAVEISESPNEVPVVNPLAERFDFEPSESMADLRCPVCLFVIHDPVQHKCGSMFCKGCVQQTTKCPCCRGHADYRPVPNMIRALIDVAEVTCMKCKLSMNYKGCASHECEVEDSKLSM